MAKTTTIAGNTFLFTGKLTEFTREDAEAHVEAEGGKVLSGVSAKLNYLVVGEDAGSKLAKAEAIGTVTILHEKEFLKMMESAKTKSKSSPKKTISAAQKTTKKSAEKINQEEIDFIFARHSTTNISKYNGIETAIGELEKKDLIVISSLIEDEEYFDSNYFTDFYSFDNLFHSQGVLVDSSDKKLKKLKDDNSLSSANVFINEVFFEAVNVPKEGVFLCSFRNEDVYLIAEGTAVNVENKIPVDCYVRKFEFVSPSIYLLDEVRVNGNTISRDGSGAEDADGQIYNSYQMLIIDGKLYEIDEEFENKKSIIKALSKYVKADKTADPEVHKIIAKLDKGVISSIDQINEKYRYHPEIVSKALEMDGYNLSRLSDEHKNNTELVKTAVKSSYSAFEYASGKLKSDRNFLAEVLNIDGRVLEFLSNEFKDDKELAIISVSNRASAIKFLNSKLKNDSEIIQSAIDKGLQNDATVLEFLPAKFQDSKDIVLKVMELNGFDLEYASNRLKSDKDCIKVACKNNPYSLTYCNEKMKSDLNFFFELLEFTKATFILEYFSDKIKDNESALLECAKYDGLNYTTGEAGAIIKFASDRLKKSKEFMLKFIKIAPYVLDFIPKDLAKDKDIKLLAKKY